MEDEDIVKEIRKIEETADRLIHEAQEKALELESASKREIERLQLESEKEFEMRASNLRLTLKENKRREESQLIARFEEAKKRLEDLDKETFDRFIGLVVKKICEG